MATDINLILAEYEDSVGKPGGARLSDFIARYPEHSELLTEYALESFMLTSAEEPLSDAPEEARVLASAKKIGQKTRAQVFPAPLNSILAAASSSGISPSELADRVGIGLALLAKLERRMIRAATIPRSLVEEMALALGRTATSVAAYLRMTPTLSASASYKASRAPRAVQEPFSKALSACPGMSPEAKKRWASDGELLPEDE